MVSNWVRHTMLIILLPSSSVGAVMGFYKGQWTMAICMAVLFLYSYYKAYYFWFNAAYRERLRKADESYWAHQM